MVEIAGHKVSPWVLVGGVAGIGVVFYIYKKGSSGSSTASTASTGTNTGTDPVTGLPYSEDNTTDPLTGMTYLAEAQEYGSVQAAEQAMSANYGAYGAGYGTTPYGGYDAGYPTSNTGYSTETATGYATNAAWSQAVTSGLVALGYSSTDVSTALGLFFAQQPLGTLADGVNAASIVQAAEAEYGPPPVGSYSIIPANTNSTGAGGTGSGATTITVPDVVGKDITDAANAVRAAGLNWSGPPAVHGQVIYVTGQTPTAGTSVASGTTVTVTVTSTATVTVPNVVGKPIDQAGPDITAAGLKYSGPAPVKGKVVTITSQTPAAGTKVDPGTTVRCLGKS